MATSVRSIGSLETWDSEDKLFTKHIFQKGSGDSKPNEGSICVVNISFIDGHGVSAGDLIEKDVGGYKFNEDVEIVVGEGDSLLSELFDKVIVTMKEGESVYVKTKVDANCKKVEDQLGMKEEMLKFNVHLKSFSRAADIGDLEPDEQLERAEHHKEKGTTIYQQNNTEFGIRRFQRALDYLDSIQSMEEFSSCMVNRVNTLRCLCNLNIAAGYLKQELYEKVIEHCNKALELENENVKGLFRRGQAYFKLHKYEEAKQDLQHAKKLDAENKAIDVQLKNVEISIKKEKQMYQKMFSQ